MCHPQKIEFSKFHGVDILSIPWLGVAGIHDRHVHLPMVAMVNVAFTTKTEKEWQVSLNSDMVLKQMQRGVLSTTGRK